VTSGIPTTYRYNAMRSRLEARWASFFDLIGWRWTYEPLDAEGYVPDFLIHGARPFFIEVGPCITQADYEAKSAKAEAAAASLGRDLLVVGVTPIADISTNWDPGDPVAGWLGEFFPATPSLDPELGGPSEDVLSFGGGMWSRCGVCDVLAVFHDFQSYTCRPCGHYTGGHHQGAANPRDLEQLWAQAGSRVQWKPAA